MHPSLAATIAARQTVVDLCRNGDHVISLIEKRTDTYLSDGQAVAIRAALDVLECEITVGTDLEVQQARQVIRDGAYAAQEVAEDIE